MTASANINPNNTSPGSNIPSTSATERSATKAAENFSKTCKPNESNNTIFKIFNTIFKTFKMLAKPFISLLNTIYKAVKTICKPIKIVASYIYNNRNITLGRLNAVSRIGLNITSAIACFSNAAGRQPPAFNARVEAGMQGGHFITTGVYGTLELAKSIRKEYQDEQKKNTQGAPNSDTQENTETNEALNLRELTWYLET